MTSIRQESIATVARELAEATAAAIRNDETALTRLRELLVGTGTVRSATELLRVLPQAFERLAAALLELFENVVPDIVRDHQEHLDDIRRFFLQPQETYSIAELATLWNISCDDVRDIYHDKILNECPDDPSCEAQLRIAWADAVGASRAFYLFRPFDIDVALGGDFECAQSEKWRTVPILVHLPRFIAEALPKAPGSFNWRRTVAVRIEEFILEQYAETYRAEYFRIDRRSN